MEQTKLIVNKCFMSKSCAFKVQLNSSKDCFFHIGQLDQSNGKWTWIKAKMNESEIGEIIKVLNGAKNSISFYHSFNGKETKLWFNRKEDFLFVKIESISKPLSMGEQEILRILLEHIIIKKNILN